MLQDITTADYHQYVAPPFVQPNVQPYNTQLYNQTVLPSIEQQNQYISQPNLSYQNEIPHQQPQLNVNTNHPPIHQQRNPTYAEEGVMAIIM